LEECFKNFTKEDTLEEGNEWYCPSCKQHVKARVKMQLYSAPHILIIHLKRFKAHQKIDTMVDFPLTDLDMSPYLIGPKKDEKEKTKYDLFAVAHHYGGMGGGHYVASCMNYFDKKWYNFNDSSVSVERDDDIRSSSAYVLFYRRQNLETSVDLQEIYNKKFVDLTPTTTKTEQEVTPKPDDANGTKPTA